MTSSAFLYNGEQIEILGTRGGSLQLLRTGDQRLFEITGNYHPSHAIVEVPSDWSDTATWDFDNHWPDVLAVFKVAA